MYSKFCNNLKMIFMTRKLIIITVLSVALYPSLFGQKISNIDFDKIRIATQDNLSNFYYPSLIERFQQPHSILTEDEYEHLYYGNVYSDDYNPYGGISDSNENRFRELFGKAKFAEAIPYGEEIIKKNPVNIQILHYLLICHHELGDKLNAEKYANKYFPLINVILGSGDGSSVHTAYVIVMVPDEYELLNFLELTVTGRKTLYEQKMDVFKIRTAGQKVAKGQKKIKELYFNISKPFGFQQQGKRE